MSVDRLLNPENPPVGHKIQEPRLITSASRTLEGGQALQKDHGHRNWNQSIHHLFERRNDIRSSVFRSVPAGGSVSLDPAKLGSYTLRFEGNASVTLRKPPRVPPEQGSGRGRSWSIRVHAFYSMAAEVNWPGNVIGARDHMLVEPEPGVFVLQDTSRLPGTPGKAGTSEVFDLIYDERTAEWFVALHSSGEETADPDSAAPDGVSPEPAPGEPETPTEPGVPVDPTDPDTENDYTDPDSGSELTPVQPPARGGDIIAIHPGALSYSADCGSTWRRISTETPNPLSASAFRGEGVVMVGDDGVARFSQDLQTWSELGLSTETRAEIPLINGGFETGDLTGWEVLSGDAPQVLDTSQPPQPEGKYYLTRDWMIINPQPFEIRQTVDVTEFGQGDFEVSVDAWVDPGQTAELEVFGGWDGKSYRMSDVRVSSDDPFNYNQKSDSLYDLILSGDLGYLGELRSIDAYAKAPDSGTVEERIRFVFTDNGGVGLWSATISEPRPAIGEDEFEKARMTLLRWPDGALVSAREFVLKNSQRPGLEIRLQVPEGWRPPIGQRHDFGDYWLLDSRDLPSKISANITLSPSGNSFSAEVTGDAGNALKWQVLSVQVGNLQSGNLDIILRGSGNPADVYFDNVRVERVNTSTLQATSVATDLVSKAHVLAAGEVLHYVNRGMTSIAGQAPFSVSVLAAAGNTISVANSSNVAVSFDGASTWRNVDVSAPVTQLFADSGIVTAVLADGSLLQWTSNPEDDALVTTFVAGSWVSRDRRRGTMVATDDLGEVSHLTPSGLVLAGEQPVSASTAAHRTVATDSGRWVGYKSGNRDVFVSDTAGTSWSLAPSLYDPILSIIEVR